MRLILMSGATLQLGLVGFGQLARRYYVPALRALDGVSVSLVIDPLAASRRAACVAFPGITASEDPGALLRERLDGVMIASRPSTHLSFWNLAAGAGLPVFLEKPFVLRGELDQAASGPHQRRLLMLDLNRRHWPPYRQIRDWVRAGVVGDLEDLEIHLHVDIRPWCSVTSHRLERAEGGVLYDLGSQAVDLACWIIGMEPQQVSAWSESHRWDNDHVLIDLNFATGVQAHCDLAYTERSHEQVVIKGRHGVIQLHDPNMSVHLRATGNTGRSVLGCVRDIAVLGYRGVRRSHSMMRYTVTAALAAFTRSISGALPFSPGFDDALANSTVLDAAARALELGGPHSPARRLDVS